MSRKYLPRLTISDVDALVRAHQFNVQADALLRGSKWQGAETAILLVGNADAVICSLYNKVERALGDGPKIPGPESQPAAPAAIAPAAELGQEPGEANDDREVKP